MLYANTCGLLLFYNVMILYLNQPFHTTYSIRTDDADLIHRLKIKFGTYINESEEGADVTVEVRELQSGLFTVSAGGETFTTPYPLQYIDEILHRNARYDDTVLALHGAAVELRGQAYLFLAATTTGKTTLASYLISKGYGYITEDCILIDRATLQVYPCTAPVHLREGGLGVLRRLGCAPENVTEFDDTAQLRYAFTPENRITEPLPIGGIFFIERTEEENELIRLTANEKLYGLMRSPITDYPVTGDYLRLLTRLSGKNCIKLRYSDMEYVAEVIGDGRA